MPIMVQKPDEVLWLPGTLTPSQTQGAAAPRGNLEKSLKEEEREEEEREEGRREEEDEEEEERKRRREEE